MDRFDDDFRPRPGRVRDRGAGSGRRAKTYVGQVMRAAKKAGHTGHRFGSIRRSGGGSRFGRGHATRIAAKRRPDLRRVIAKMRVVRHRGLAFRAAPIARHISYLEREGVTRDGDPAQMFDAAGDAASGDAFADRCQDDRHHFRLIVSPEDAAEMQDLRAFTRELMTQAEQDLGTHLDWVAVDHWNTDNPHVHILIRGRAGPEEDLVISRRYVREGFRHAAEDLVTMELGPRREVDIQAARLKEIDAERWTSLDASLRDIADRHAGIVDLRPGDQWRGPEDRLLLIGRAQKLEQLGLADAIGSSAWTLKPGIEETLRDLSIRGDIIKTMHQAMARGTRSPDPASFAIHPDTPHESVLGRLVERGLHDELQGTAYAVVEGIDGRTHHIRFDDLDMTGDASPGSIVETRTWEDNRGRKRLSLATRSDLPLDKQISADGATWLDRQLTAAAPPVFGKGFAAEVVDALEARTDHLVEQGLAERRGRRVIFARALIRTLRDREVIAAQARIAGETGMSPLPVSPGEQVEGVYRERVVLASGRFARIDSEFGFQLVPWRPALEQHMGQHVAGTITPTGGVAWSFDNTRELGI